MTISTVTPCTPWATSSDLPETCSDAAVRPDTLDDALRFASTILFNLTHRRWRGECSDTYRPHDGFCWACARDAVNPDHRALRLPAVGVRSITQVSIGGTVIDPATYELRDGRWLWRKRNADGSGATSWPCWQDTHERLDGQSTFVVAYTWGQDPPAEMVLAAALLGWEFALGWTPDCENRCKLPRNITSLTRNGITTSFPNPSDLFDQGKTGLPEVDLLVAAVNRGEAKQRPMVVVPGRTPGTRGAGTIA